jgi:hypothetical protein
MDGKAVGEKEIKKYIIFDRSCASSNKMKILSNTMNILGFMVMWHLEFVLSWLKRSVCVCHY